jgi:hypothetical protein
MSKTRFPYPAYVKEDTAVGVVYTPCMVLEESAGQCHVRIERYHRTIWHSTDTVWVAKSDVRKRRNNVED